ncbi:MAG: hypothetical protein ACLRRT_10410 [Ruthenibacterium lactatiformans]
MKKGRLRAKSRAFSGVVRKGGFVPLRYAPAGAVTTPFLRHSPRGLHFAAQRCMALPPPAFFGRFFSFFAFFDRLKNHFFSTATQISQV